MCIQFWKHKLICTDNNAILVLVIQTWTLGEKHKLIYSKFYKSYVNNNWLDLKMHLNTEISLKVDLFMEVIIFDITLTRI